MLYPGCGLKILAIQRGGLACARNSSARPRWTAQTSPAVRKSDVTTDHVNKYTHLKVQLNLADHRFDAIFFPMLPAHKKHIGTNAVVYASSKSVRPSQWSQSYIGTSQQESWGDRCGIQFKRQISNCTEAYAIELTRNPIRILSEQSRYPAEWRVSKEGWNLFRTCENSNNVKASFPCRWRFAKFNLRNACLHGLLRKGKARSNLERVCRFPAKRTKGKIK